MELLSGATLSALLMRRVPVLQPIFELALVTLAFAVLVLVFPLLASSYGSLVSQGAVRPFGQRQAIVAVHLVTLAVGLGFAQVLLKDS